MLTEKEKLARKLDDTTGKESEQCIFKKANQATVITTPNVVKMANIEIQVDP